MKLDKSIFLDIVRYTPLVSIDLLVFNQHNDVLLGLRKNPPAKDYWFVPGGRIRKEELIEVAFERLTKAELGKSFPLAQAQFVGVFEHLYDHNFADQPGFGTHCVVLAYQLRVAAEDLTTLPVEQHGDYRWFTVAQALENKEVHPYTQAYFNSSLHFTQT